MSYYYSRGVQVHTNSLFDAPSPFLLRCQLCFPSDETQKLLRLRLGELSSAKFYLIFGKASKSRLLSKPDETVIFSSLFLSPYCFIRILLCFDLCVFTSVFGWFFFLRFPIPCRHLQSEGAVGEGFHAKQTRPPVHPEGDGRGAPQDERRGDHRRPAAGDYGGEGLRGLALQSGLPILSVSSSQIVAERADIMGIDEFSVF